MTISGLPRLAWNIQAAVEAAVVSQLNGLGSRMRGAVGGAAQRSPTEHLRGLYIAAANRPSKRQPPGGHVLHAIFQTPETLWH